jgi:hypothetical protein
VTILDAWLTLHDWETCVTDLKSLQTLIRPNRMGTRLTIVRHSERSGTIMSAHLYNVNVIAFHRLTFHASWSPPSRPSAQDNCKQIEDLSALTASHSTHLCLTRSPPFKLCTVTLSSSLNGVALASVWHVCPYTQLFSTTLQFLTFFLDVSDIFYMFGTVLVHASTHYRNTSLHSHRCRHLVGTSLCI